MDAFGGKEAIAQFLGKKNISFFLKNIENKMKVKIITLHSPINYGAALQAYALKSYLQNEGYDAELIDYRPKYVTEKQGYTYAGSLVNSKNYLKKALYLIAKFPSRYRAKRNFGRFLKNELCSTGPIYRNYDELKANPPVADVYICGSDQIWNLRLPNGWDDAFYLDFVKAGKRCSYAASMAVDIDFSEKEKKYLREKLSKMDRISVREQKAQQNLQKILYQKVSVVLDPVFLLSVNQWKNLANNSHLNLRGKNYILIYPMGNAQKVYDYAHKLSDITGLPVYSISRSFKKGHTNKLFSGCSPYDFLCLFANASFVVTNSFHGTAFSIIFRKEFWAFGTDDTSIGNTSSRFETLLQRLGLVGRYSPTSIPEINKKIEYDEEKIRDAIRESYDFVLACLNDK